MQGVDSSTGSDSGVDVATSTDATVVTSTDATVDAPATVPDIFDAAYEGSFDASSDGPAITTEAGIIEGSCSHDVCTAGTRLGQQCDACTLTVCKNDPYCCDTYWGPSCFADVQTYCGHTCP